MAIRVTGAFMGLVPFSAPPPTQGPAAERVEQLQDIALQGGDVGRVSTLKKGFQTNDLRANACGRVILTHHTEVAPAHLPDENRTAPSRWQQHCTNGCYSRGYALEK